MSFDEESFSLELHLSDVESCEAPILKNQMEKISVEEQVAENTSPAEDQNYMANEPIKR